MSGTSPSEMNPSEPESSSRGLRKGNREVLTDLYVDPKSLSESADFAFKVFVRLNAKKVTFHKVSFKHCIFDGCYLNGCVFNSCDFTGCRFLGSNFHQCSFAGCRFEYATFERCQIDDAILVSEAPKEENLRMRFARSLRMNYQQVGDAKAVNRAISVELQATAIYLLKSWKSDETYYKTKYAGFKAIPQFLRWTEFWVLDFIWGNGESIFKLIRTLGLLMILIGVYGTCLNGNPLDLRDYLRHLELAPGIFFGVGESNSYPPGILTVIAASRYIGLALLTALLVKRFGRR